MIEFCENVLHRAVANELIAAFYIYVMSHDQVFVLNILSEYRCCYSVEVTRLLF